MYGEIYVSSYAVLHVFQWALFAGTHTLRVYLHILVHFCAVVFRTFTTRVTETH